MGHGLTEIKRRRSTNDADIVFEVFQVHLGRTKDVQLVSQGTFTKENKRIPIRRLKSCPAGFRDISG